MKRKALCLLFAAVLGMVSSPGIQAFSDPTIQGSVYGAELCPQSVCGSAVFVGVFGGVVGHRFQFGLVGVSVTHEALPDETGEFSDITGGVWELRTATRRFRGAVTEGEILYNGDNTYTVAASLELTHGGSGTLYAEVILDHNVFPPTIEGCMSQILVCP